MGTIDDSPSHRGSGTGPRVHYIARLPKLPDGAFDMASIPSVVAENLRSLGAETFNGIVYQATVDATLQGTILTEPALRKERRMKAGTSQRAFVQLRAMGLVESLAIVEGSVNG